MQELIDKLMKVVQFTETDAGFAVNVNATLRLTTTKMLDKEELARATQVDLRAMAKERCVYEMAMFIQSLVESETPRRRDPMWNGGPGMPYGT